MKHPDIVFIVVITFCFQTNIFAQQPKFEGGVEGGPGITSLWGNEIVTRYNDPTLGFSGGASFQYNFPKTFSIRTNFSFDRKGCISSGTLLDASGNRIGDYTSLLKFDYLTMPILLRASFGKKTKFFFNSGPYFAYLTKSNYVFEGPNINGRATFDFTSNYKRFDVGLSSGAGFSTPVTKAISFSCEIRNNIGLYNIGKPQLYSETSLNTYSANLLLGIAYTFGARVEAVK
jgi:hypothetical protein